MGECRVDVRKRMIDETVNNIEWMNTRMKHEALLDLHARLKLFPADECECDECVAWKVMEAMGV